MMFGSTLLFLALSLISGSDSFHRPEHVHRFPWSEQECNRRYNVASAHFDAIVSWADPSWRSEAMEMKFAWFWLKRAKETTGQDRLHALRKLEEVIGTEDYLLGRMPDFLPEHRFRPREAHER